MANKKKIGSAPRETVEVKPRSSEKEAPEGKSQEVKAVERQRESRPAPEQRREKRPSIFARLLNIRFIRFIYESYYELREKVTWPTLEQARNMTIAVIALSIAVGLILGIADAGLFQLFRLVTGTGR
jgi:preprotein translocase SecE subunit